MHKWFTSYLTNRMQYVKITDTDSRKQQLMYGVPQGSVLGPILFSLYVKGVANIIRKHNISFHQYADDIQLYTSFDKYDMLSTFTKMEHCLRDISVWMNSHKLKLNQNKTEFIIIHSKYNTITDIAIPTMRDHCTVVMCISKETTKNSLQIINHYHL